MSRGHNQRNEAVRSVAWLSALTQRQDKSLLVWASLAHLQPCTAGQCKRQEESELLPSAGSAGDAFILYDYTTPSTHGLCNGARGAMRMGLLVPLLLLRADQLLDPLPVPVKSSGLTSQIY